MIRHRVAFAWGLALSVAGISTAVTAAQEGAEEGFVSLFNGRDLAGWSADPEHWRVEDGAIVGTTTTEKPLTKGNTFAVWQGSATVPKELANFEVRLRYRFDVDANNSGVQIRSRLLPEVTPWTISGYQCDLGWNAGLTATLHHERGRNGLAGVGQKVVVDSAGRRWIVGNIAEAKEIAPHVRVRDWNDAAIRAVGNRIECFHNGRQSLELLDHDDRGDDVKGRALAGLLALQLHAGPPMQVRFKDIRVKPLPAGGLVSEQESPIPPGAREIIPKRPAGTPPAAPAATTRPNLAPLAKATCSSEQPGNAAARAIDDDRGSRWCAESGASPQWWRADFDAPQQIIAVDLEWEFPEIAYRYVVETSADGTMWHTVADATRGTKGVATHPIAGPFSSGVRAMRVRFLGCDGGWASLREVRFIAPEGTVVPSAASLRRQAQTPDLLREVKAREGFDVTMFATPAEANYPVFVAATHDGTLFVSSDGNGSLGRDPHRGRILRLRDTDGDGAADEVREFVSDLDSPRGLLWVDDRLVVLHPPHVSSFRDADGDGIAEERTLLVRGIAFDYSKRPADHTSNGLALGIDGWIYAAIGDFGFMDARGTDGRQLQLRGGGLVRFRPDGSGLDLFARGTRNNLEAAVGPLLDMITRDNTNDGGGWNVRLHAFTGLEDHGYPRRYMHFADEIVAPLADYGGGSGTGACWIDEPWMPARLNDAAFTCDWGRGQVYRHGVTAKGAGYEATQEEFLGITRSTDLDVDALGHSYAASWRGGGFSWAGPEIGFIVRLTPQGLEPGTSSDMAKADAVKLLGLLAGPSHKLRLEAQRALVARGLVPKLAAELEKIAADATVRHAVRVAALFTLTLGRKGDAVPAVAKLAADPTIAAWAVRGLGDLAAEGVAVPHDALRAALASADPRTRKEAVVAVVRAAGPEAPAAILPLATDADPIVAHTAVEGLVRLSSGHEGAVIAACSAVLNASGTPPALHRAAARVLGEMRSDQAVDAVLTRLASATAAAARANLVWAASRQWRRESAWKGESWGTRPDTRGPCYAPEEWTASPRLAEAIVKALGAAPADELDGLARAVGLHRLPVAKVVPALLARNAARALTTFLDVAGEAPPEETFAVIRTIAADTRATPDERLTAIRVLARSPAPQAIRPLISAVAALEAGGCPAGVAAAARKAARESTAVLADLDTVVAGAAEGPVQAELGDEILLAVAGSSAAKSAVRGAAAARLAADWQGDGARRLALVAASVRTGAKVLATDLVAAADQSDDAQLKTAAETALRTLGIDATKVREIAADAGPKLADRKVDDVLKLVDERRGDRAIGAELFVARKCVACHAAGVDSAGLGPSLANAAGIYSRQQLAESVLRPNKSIAQGFATTALTLQDGRQLVGFVTSEAADVVVLRDAQGVEHRVEKTLIDERHKLPTSIMPEGLVADLTVAQFASLIDYIEALGK